MNGNYTLNFRAKGLGGNNQMIVQVSRANRFFLQTVNLSNSWQDYSFTFSASESGAVGTAALTFKLAGAAALLDDVSLVAASTSSTNPTAYRDEVVATLRNLRPGILRYMDSGTNWGSSIDNMIAPPFARLRAGYSDHNTEQDDIPVGLHEFLTLCQTVGSEPWFTMPTGMSTQEMTNLMEYLGGSSSTTYGAKRAALGQTAPWTSVLPVIHLEFGNEVWNTANPGALMNDPAGYGKRAGIIFGTAHASPYYSASSFDLIVDGWASVSAWTQQVLAASSNYDTIDIAPYIFGSFNDASSNEAIYGPMFAEPEIDDSTTNGIVQQNARVAAAAAHPAKLAVYETNLGTVGGSVSQASIDAVVPSLGGGLAEVNHMLMMMRDAGINAQTMFSLAGWRTTFTNAAIGGEKTPVWGSVVDMGNTNRIRPTMMAEQLANSAILPSLLTTIQSGSNPTWNQATSANDGVAVNGAHYLQSFAFTDGAINKLVLFNVSRTSSLPVTFTGANAPTGNATIQTLTSTNITDNNEDNQNVTVQTTSATLVAGQSYTLPPFSMVVITTTAPAMSVSAVNATCTPAALYAANSVPCTASVIGHGTFTSDVTWSADSGSISPNGTYTAPATAPASGKANITAVSKQDPTKKTTTTVVVAPAPTVTGVTVKCALTSITTGATTTCSAAVTGTGAFQSTVTWSASAGTITSAGVYTAPTTAVASGVVAITAVSTQDTTRSASTNVGVSSVRSVTVVCLPASIATGKTTTCTATVLGAGSFNTAVKWSADAGTITAAGVYTAPATVPASGKANITATSVQDATKFGTLPVTITLTPTITAVAPTCTPSTVGAGLTTVCSATVTGTGAFSSGVTWTTTAGTITAAGHYSAPGAIPASGKAIVTATSTQDTTKFATTTITIVTPVTVKSVLTTCGSATVSTGSSATCYAGVTGTGAFNSAVTWTTNVGTISTKGVYTAPATVPASGLATITATSVQDTTKSNATVISITAPTTIKTVTASCGAASLTAGSATNCTAAVTGTGAFSTKVAWTAVYGYITSNGSYAAPTTVPAAGRDTITAVSLQDGTKLGSATIAVTPQSGAVRALYVTCTPTSVAPGAVVLCSAKVSGAGAFNSNVTWSTTGGTIDQTGRLTAPSTLTSVNVIAVSQQTPTVSGSATVVTTGMPVISGVTVSKLTATSATISWTSSVITVNGMSYTTPAGAGGLTPSNATKTTNPSFTLTGLLPGQVYYINLWSNNNGALTSQNIAITLPTS